MKFGDIVALAKSGFTYSNIKELMALDTEVVVTEEQKDATPGIADISPTDTEAGAAPAPAPEPEKTSPDYGEEIQKLKDELQKTKADLAKAQKVNAHADVSTNKPDPQKNLDDIVRSFM